MGKRGTRIRFSLKKKYYDMFFKDGLSMAEIARKEKVAAGRQGVRYHIVTYQKYLQGEWGTNDK